MGTKPGIKATGVSPDGTRHYRITGLPGQPKEIPGLIRRTKREWSRSGSGPQLAGTLILPGYAVTVQTDRGAIVVRVARGPEPLELVGKVERLDTRQPVADIHGIRSGDMVVVPSIAYVHHVDTSPR